MSGGTALRVTSLHVYPVKSLGGVDVEQVEVGALGLALDRRWMLVDEDGVFLTQREDARMALLRVALAGTGGVEVTAPGGDRLRLAPPAPDAPRRAVRIWAHLVDGCTYPPEVDAWFAEALGRRCRLVWMPDDARRPVDDPHAHDGDRAPFSDGFPVLVATRPSLDDLNARLAARGEPPAEMARFRPNVVVAGAAAPYAEDGWGEIEAGSARLALVKPCARCVVTTLDPATGRGGVEPLRTLAEYRRSGAKVLFAQNALVRAPGRVRVGDAVRPLAGSA